MTDVVQIADWCRSRVPGGAYSRSTLELAKVVRREATAADTPPLESVEVIASRARHDCVRQKITFKYTCEYGGRVVQFTRHMNT